MYHSGSQTQWVITYIPVETKCFQPKIDKVINSSNVVTFKRHQEFKKVRQRKMYKIYFTFRKKKKSNDDKNISSKNTKEASTGENRKQRLAYGCQDSSVREVLKIGCASPIIYIQDQCDRYSLPRAMARFFFFNALQISFQWLTDRVAII